MTSQFEKINAQLLFDLRKKYPKQLKDIFKQDKCEIEESFLGFVDTYYYLSLIIPKHFTVIDLGCSYALQSYYFRNHKHYIGVDKSTDKRLKLNNTEHLYCSIDFYLKLFDKNDTDEVFAICNYAPINTEEIRNKFKNIYVYYPAGNSILHKEGK